MCYLRFVVGNAGLLVTTSNDSLCLEWMIFFFGSISQERYLQRQHEGFPPGTNAVRVSSLQRPVRERVGRRSDGWCCVVRPGVVHQGRRPAGGI